MRYFTQSFNIDQPTTVLFQPALTRRHPNIVEIADYWGRCGAGIGLGTSAGLSSLGEYYERRHFFSEVSYHRKALLQETLGEQETVDFKFALQQTMTNDESPELLKNHPFKKTAVKRLVDFSDCEIPTVCLAISPRNLELDNKFHPVRDTCGCSFHWNLESAIFGALKESIERQFLLKFWLTMKFSKKLYLPNYTNSLASSGAFPLLQALESAGNVTAFDITDRNFPGKCVIVLYGTDDAQHLVHYCTGMSYSDSIESALEKAIYELWQTFRFIRNFHTTKTDLKIVKDPYLRHFLNCNTYSTYLEITNASPENMGQPKPLTSPTPFTIHALINSITQANINGYLYIKPTKKSRTPYFFCKYISPTAFMHMNNASHINLNNNYSARFTNEINTARQQTMVPFP